MKKLIYTSSILFSLFFLASCDYQNRKVNFTQPQAANLGKIENLKLVILDRRRDLKKIGTKELGKKKVEIENQQNLEKLIYNKMINKLNDRNFMLNNERILEIYLIKLTYKAKRSLVIGKTETNIVMKSVVRNLDREALYRKSHRLNFSKDYPISSTAKADEKNINMILEEAINRIVNDRDLIKSLVKN